jgi:hypothetical protein
MNVCDPYVARDDGATHEPWEGFQCPSERRPIGMSMVHTGLTQYVRFRKLISNQEGTR